MILVLLIIGLIIYIPYIKPYKHSGGAPELSKQLIYLPLAREKLKSMFDHQISYKTKNGSWLSVSFQNMKRFNKDGIWNTLVEGIGVDEASKLYPRTYMLPRDIHQVMNIKGKHSFILKKVNSWARQGLKIVDDKNDVVLHSQEYDLVQVLIPNPHLINKFKYDIRMFLIVHYKYGILLFKQSYFSYSNTPYDPTSSDMFARIGSMHLTPEFYQKNNLPTKATDYTLYPTLYPQITTMLTNIFNTYPKPLLTPQEIDSKRIKIFGIDVNVFRQSDGSLRPMLIEMNSNPSLLFPEADWKNKVIYDMVTAIGQSDLSQFTVIRNN
jgi:hypothetical protein